MSPEPTSVVPESVDASRGDVNKQPTDDITNRSNGDSAIAKATDENNPLEEKRLSEDSKPVEGPQPTGPSHAPGASEAQPSAADEKKDEANAGDKREHEATATSTGPDNPSVPEPATKKQKTDEKAEAESTNGVEGPVEPAAANGEKKKGGRPKKSKETVRKAIPTDGVGSRTRSRTKAN
ncbi:hypothetical protein ATEG_04713 [Aspergillus terreus]|uniref:Uncharacterized protein n=1 Tax=Aspergillus terreus TaxID=33178 RepID=A0A5M3YPU9_ASPTE|nr:hypothetical protein ATETN484_0002072500 [Aspergillus terreus]GFF15581.1 hypothetical protein ATEG_04713 [Aspergillus terreus]